MGKEAKPAKKKAPVKEKKNVDYGAKIRERLKKRMGVKRAKR
jgi:hypothetical protein